MLRSLILLLLVASSGACASFRTYPPVAYVYQPDRCNNSTSELCPLFTRISDISEIYRSQAQELGNSAGTLNLLAATSATATLAFAGFDAHPDNTLTSTLLAGVTTATGRTLKPGERAALRARAVNSLYCIATKGEALDARRFDVYGQDFSLLIPNRTPMGIAGSTSSSFSEATRYRGYEQLDLLLLFLMAEGQKIEKPSDSLVSAIATAQAGRVELAKGISARNSAYGTMADAIATVSKAVNDETPPDVSVLIEQIAKIELPKPSPPPGSGGGDTPAPETMLPADGKSAKLMGTDDLTALLQRIADKAEEDRIKDEQITLLLNTLSARIAQLAPAKDAELVTGMTACLAKLTTG